MNRGLNISVVPRTLHFKQPAGTSRGVYTERRVWYVVVRDADGRMGVGECAPLPKLSCDDLPDYEDILRGFCRDAELTGTYDAEVMRSYPSMLFGLETAFRHLESGSVRFFENSFSSGQTGILINGLIWMGTYDEMKARIEEKTALGFKCIKLKIGAIDFERELDLIRMIRSEFPASMVELRVDANGAFAPDDALDRLCRLSQYGLHSIEQPIRAGQWEAMAQLCRQTPLPIALDEELIGVNSPDQKRQLLDTVKPQYIILKPSLHGGIAGSKEWIRLADERGIGWWITSALESNVGLNAIAQWVGTLSPSIPQGLGTGLLFTDNIDYPLTIRGERLWMEGGKEPSFAEYLRL